MKNSVVILIGISIFLLCVAASGLMTTKINAQREDLDLTISDELYDLPPEMAITQAALGTFRGVAINALWQRAESLKNEGKYYEAVELGEWITKLQPRFPMVWEFVSWNQSYNISVGTHTPRERWFWVRSGIDMLQKRGGGIDSNPNTLRLYQQLAWIYHHKVGMFQDQFNWYYKRELASEWHAILGDPPKEQDDYLKWFTLIAEAPKSEGGLPEGSQRLMKWLRDNGWDADVATLRAFTVGTRRTAPPETGDSDFEAVVGQGSAAGNAEARALAPQYFEPEQTWPEFATQEDVDATIRFIRRQVLTDDLHNMDPAMMLADAREFGPLDWRHPATHAMYWARRGLGRLETGDVRSASGITNVRRQIFNSLEQQAEQGQVVFDAATGYVSYLPVWAYWLKYDSFFFELVDEAGPTENIPETFMAGYRNRMDGAILAAELYGARGVAEDLMERMRQRMESLGAEGHYNRTLDDFLAEQYQDTLENPGTARNAITTLLLQSWTRRWVFSEDDTANAIREKAFDLHQGWRRLNANPADPLYHEVPDFGVLELQAIGGFLTGQSGRVGQINISLATRSEVWRNALTERQREQLVGPFGQALWSEAQNEGYEPFTVFPPPPRALKAMQQNITPEQREAARDSDIDRAGIEQN